MPHCLSWCIGVLVSWCLRTFIYNVYKIPTPIPSAIPTLISKSISTPHQQEMRLSTSSNSGEMESSTWKKQGTCIITPSMSTAPVYKHTIHIQHQGPSTTELLHHPLRFAQECHGLGLHYENQSSGLPLLHSLLLPFFPSVFVSLL